MITLNNNTFLFRDQQRAKLWQTHQFRPLVGQTLMVIGLGNIGRWVAHNGKALGMEVIGVRRSAVEDPNVDRMITPDQIKAFIGEADVVTLHVRQTAETHHLIDGDMIAAMKPGGMLINTSRGPIVAEEPLIAALESGQIGSAYLDVFDTEPLPGASKFWEMDNVLLTPHTSDHVEDWPLIFAHFFADNLERYKANEPLVNLV